MNHKILFRNFILINLLIAQSSWVIALYLPSDLTISFYKFYGENYTIEDPSSFIISSHYIGISIMLISIIGMLLFWPISRILFIISYIFMLPGYFIEPPLFYSPVTKIMYDLGMVGSGIIVAISFTEPVNSLFKNKANKAVKRDK